MLELVIGHNAFDRFVSPLKPLAANLRGPETRQAAGSGEVESASSTSPGAEPVMRTLYSRLFVRTPKGPLRLANGQLAAQMAWLFPFAAMAMVIGIGQNRLRRPLTATHLALSVLVLLDYNLWGAVQLLRRHHAFLLPFNHGTCFGGIGGYWGCQHVELLPPKGFLCAPSPGYAAGNCRLAALHSGECPRLVTQPAHRPVEQLAELASHRANWRDPRKLPAGLLLIRFQSVSNQATYGLAVGSLTIGIMAVLVLPVAWVLSGTVFLPGQGVLPS